MRVHLEFGPFVPGFSSMHMTGSKSEPSTEKFRHIISIFKGKCYKQFFQKTDILELKGEKKQGQLSNKAQK